ncbi:hypothetical protein [Mesorhizobium sp. CO1-1-4]|uniref:hypothetical protein n=1 Tax=Mesorhizobium sp. CO1-1-4 TaxID=2876633 RepID=UPI001CCA24D0|nr:hypothetical protein [Mesorhizobium sp. CO1-1-4]MBZ9742232.1 hypothetical protein [Mesorhizobium sp. CO1-1-4]
MQMLGFVKPAQDTCNGQAPSENVSALAPEELRVAMLKFVEALAIADARRDHLLGDGVSIDQNFEVDSDHVEKDHKA